MITWWRILGQRIKHAWSGLPGRDQRSVCGEMVWRSWMIRTYPGPARGVLLDAAAAQPCQACVRGVGAGDEQSAQPNAHVGSGSSPLTGRLGP